ncbi:hypothetical protein ES705_09705 [subsurface metagenome]
MKTTENNHPKFHLLTGIREKIFIFFRLIQQKYLIFLFFLALSILAWFIRALSDTYDADIKYPVKYTNLPPDKVLLQAPTEKLLLRVRSDGYTILSTKLISKPPIDYDVNAFLLFSLSIDSTSVYTLTKYNRERLSLELNKKNKKFEILDISPDTLFFNFSRVKRKKICVKAQLKDMNTMFAQQHMLNGSVYTIPDSIEVTGPSSIVDTLSYMTTKLLHLVNLSDTTEKKVQIQKLSRLTYSLSKVKVVIPVDEFTESEFTIPVTQKNVPDSIILKTFPKTIKVKYLITLSNFDKVSSEMFEPYVDYDEIDIDMNSKIKIKLDSLPPYVHNVNITPRSAEFLIERKNAESWNNGRNR